MMDGVYNFLNMRRIISFGTLLMLSVGSLIAQADKPNIIFILTDDLGYGDIDILFQNQRKGGAG